MAQALQSLGYGVVMSVATHDSVATPAQRADVASYRGAAMVLQLLIEEGGSEYGFATYHCGFPHTPGASVGPTQSLIDSARRMSFAFQKAAAASLGSSFSNLGVLTDSSATNLYSDPIASFLEAPLLQADFKVVSTDVSTGPKRLSMADAIAKGVVEALKNR